MNVDDISKAVEILQAGGLVALPTETVYGLAADATNPEAIRRIFRAKQRPIDHPLIVHLADIDQLSEWACEIPDAAYQLGRQFWPGPLTLILKKAPQVSPLVTGGQETIGLRIPQHSMALAVLQRLGRGLAAPSANRFGKISPTTAEAVREELGKAVDWILEGGQCTVGLESTIVDMTGTQPAILRPGAITAEQISIVLNQPVAINKKEKPRVPGSHESHYAPDTRVRLLKANEVDTFLQNLCLGDIPLAIITPFPIRCSMPGVLIKVMPSEPQHYAHDLYQVLRDLDKQELREIIVIAVPAGMEWEAVRDRLQRSAG